MQHPKITWILGLMDGQIERYVTKKKKYIYIYIGVPAVVHWVKKLALSLRW